MDVKEPGKIIVEELDLVFFKSILKEMSLWTKKN